VKAITRDEMKIIPTQDLVRRADDLLENIAGIKAQLEAAKGKAVANGEYSDPDWFSRAQFALRMKGREHQMILTEIAARRKEEKRKANDTVERRFIDVARRRLDPELFGELMREAQEEGEQT
jgi:hypothetical protein